MPKFIPEWCICTDPDLENAVFLSDGCCPCGLEKHHYHCPRCGGILQIG
ncbi:MAG: hypothetical protein WD069_16200 [Planctomycetales bacterium]